ncbi:SDR family NAD(P)-dependent oxidoreductase [Yinghuangia seranimata]|uniref:SDR family NAD(P)-dependent oxidoreductase n=1 Tax=Yinghuangia seranimata TaxID=408067 RepID=UPI00248B9648|nr:SDR family NAD(P)-dependent oxidoreductase [Yinghuangia seranimata]MDI2125631.1 SDR family NAD(P)-dependent oxidoreductase [Yinghuangia seranimata]
MRIEAGQVAVVTGAAGGIGYGTAQAFAGRGMSVVLADQDGARLAEGARSLREAGARVLAVPTDVRDLAAVQALSDAALTAFGRVDVVCNNAGVWTLGRQWETSAQQWAWVIDVNLWGVIHGVRTFVPLLLAQPGGGHIVNTASMGGMLGAALTGPYSATKHAVVGLTKGLLAELADTRVGVSLVCPGKVASGMLDHVAGPGDSDSDASGTATLGPRERAVLDTMRGAQAGAMSARDAGEHIASAVEHDRFWVLPGAQAHEPLLQRDFAELTTAFHPEATD